MRTLRREIEAENRRHVLSTAGVGVSVLTEDGPCPQCLGPTKVQKSITRNVVTCEHGALVAQETVRVCAAGCKDPQGNLVTLRCEDLSRRVAPGKVHGYDLEVHAGTERFVRHQQRQEIRDGLHENAIPISSGQVSALGLRFLQHLAALHHKNAPAIRQALARDGGYTLHFDATGEDGRGTHLVAYAGERQWVLGAWKISTERAELILPRLREVVADFGEPYALMRDLGRAGIKAAAQLVKGFANKAVVLACHWHFLRDVGRDLLADSHEKLRNLTRQHRLRPKLRALARSLGRRLSAELPELRDDVSTWIESAAGHQMPQGSAGLALVRSMIQWVLDYARDSSHQGFPFDRPYSDLYERCRKVRRAIDAFLRTPQDKRVRRALLVLARVLDPVVSDPSFAEVAATLASRAALFDELREALRLMPDPAADNAATPALLPEQAAAAIQDIRRAVDRLKRSLRLRRPQRGPGRDVREAIDIILDHLKRHGRSLWGHVIQIPQSKGGGFRVVARTNMLLEGFFHLIKHAERRRSGRKILTHDFECLPAQAPLAFNLDQADYVELLCGSLERLPRAFADLDAQSRQHARQHPVTVAKLPTEPELVSASLPSLDRPLVREKSLRIFIEAAAGSRAPRYEFASR